MQMQGMSGASGSSGSMQSCQKGGQAANNGNIKDSDVKNSQQTAQNLQETASKASPPNLGNSLDITG